MKRLTLILLLLQLFIGYSYAQRAQRGQRGTLRQRVQQQSQSGKNYDDFVKETNEKYQAFRDSVNSQYAAFMEKVWKDHPIEEAEEAPIEEEVEPVVYDQEKDEQYLA